VYEDFYGLSGKPFQLNPDPAFFYHSTGHQRAMAYLRYGLQQGQGFIIVTGDVGTGKTMLVNNLFRELESQDVVAAKIVSSNINENDLLRMVCAEFELPFERLSKASLLKQLEVFFKSCADDGKRVLLVVDEVQNLPRGSLEELRMLSNFTHKGVPVVQSFLLGQREFRAIMRAPGLEQLRQRVLAAYHLKPLSSAETETYVKHRLTKVGWAGDPEIDGEVYQGVYQYTSGVPRRINTLMDRLLLNASLEESHTVTFEDLRGITQEISHEQDLGRAEDEEDDDWAVAEPPAPKPLPRSSSRKPATPPSPTLDSPQDAAAAAEIRRLEAKLAAMQRAFDNLTSDMTRQEQSTHAGPPVPVADPSARRAWAVAAALGGLVILLLVVFFFLNNA